MTAAPKSAEVREDLTDRFWLIIREPGMVPDRKGPWKHTETAKVLREFMAARPMAFIDHLTIGPDGTPDVNHGPEVLQMADGRSMSVGRKHNARVKAAAIAAQTPPPAAVEDGYARAIEDAAKVAESIPTDPTTPKHILDAHILAGGRIAAAIRLLPKERGR